MKEKLFKTYSNEEIAQLIYDEFVSDNSLTDDNVRKKFESFEELFWSGHQAKELLQIYELENRQGKIFDITWFKIIELEKELVLKRNKILKVNTLYLILFLLNHLQKEVNFLPKPQNLISLKYNIFNLKY